MAKFIFSCSIGMALLSGVFVNDASIVRAAEDTAADREKALKLDLEEGLQMIENRKLILFQLDFLAGSVPFRMSSRQAISGGADEQLTKLAGVLQGAIKAKPTFNRTRTLAQIDCVIEPIRHVEETAPEKKEGLYREIEGSTDGFGANFSNAMFAAAGTLDSGNQEKFVRGMFPLKELGRVTQGDQIKRLLFRLTQNPEMAKTMIRDLQQIASAKDVKISKATGEATSIAVVKLPSRIPDGKDREYRFELVEGNWRFFDSEREARKEHTKLMSAPVAGYTIPGRQVTIIMIWQTDSWKMRGEPLERQLNEE